MGLELTADQDGVIIEETLDNLLAQWAKLNAEAAELYKEKVRISNKITALAEKQEVVAYKAEGARVKTVSEVVFTEKDKQAKFDAAVALYKMDKDLVSFEPSINQRLAKALIESGGLGKELLSKYTKVETKRSVEKDDTRTAQPKITSAIPQFTSPFEEA